MHKSRSKFPKLLASSIWGLVWRTRETLISGSAVTTPGNGAAPFPGVVTAEPDINVSRVRHTKPQILLASNLGNFDRDLCIGSSRGKQRDKDDQSDPTHNCASKKSC